MNVTSGLLTFAQLTTAWFAGGAIYLSVAEHPARMLLGSRIAAAQFTHSIPRAERMMPALAIASCIAALSGIAIDGSLKWWLCSAAYLGLLALTIARILPINRAVFASCAQVETLDVLPLLNRWGRLHLLRALLGLAGCMALHLLP